MLTFSPKKRISINEALEHQYMYDFHNPKYEPDCEKIISIGVNDNAKPAIKIYQ
jgi:hypothetical protein